MGVFERTAIAAAIVCASSATAAQSPQICADRPGKSTETCTVPAGHFQIETGFADWTVSNNDGQRDTLLLIGETTFKYGLTDRSDIELDVTPWARTTSRASGIHEAASGFGDMTLIYKQELTPGDAALQFAVYPFVKIPTAKRPIGNGKWEGGLVIPVQYSIPNSPLSLTFGPEIDWLADEDGRGHHAAMVQVASIGWQVTPKLSVSAEIWGQWNWDPAATQKQVSLDPSVAYIVNNDLQIDAGANVGLNRNTPDLEIYAGIAKQF